MRTVLALDLGTTTGWCVGTAGHQISGVWQLKPGRFDGGGMRFVKFRQALNDIHSAHPVNEVAFEEVRRHIGTDAAHVYGGLMAVLTEWCEVNKIPYEGVPVGTIKKFATGKGNADKKAMIEWAYSEGYSPIDDNEADALALHALRISAGRGVEKSESTESDTYSARIAKAAKMRPGPDGVPGP